MKLIALVYLLLMLMFGLLFGIQLCPVCPPRDSKALKDLDPWFILNYKYSTSSPSGGRRNGARRIVWIVSLCHNQNIGPANEQDGISRL